MKKNALKRGISALLALIMIACLAPFSALAEDAPEEVECEAPPQEPQEETFSVTVDSFGDEDGEIVPYEETEEEAESFCAVSDTDSIGVNADVDAAQVSIGEPIEMGGDDSTIVPVEEFEDPFSAGDSFDSVFEGIEKEEGEDYELSEEAQIEGSDPSGIGAGAYLSLSRTSMVIDKNGESKYATVTAVNAPSGAKVKTVDFNGILLTTGINSGTILQKGNTCELFVTGNRTGTYTVLVCLVNKIGLVLDTARVSVTVCQSTLSRSSDVSIYDDEGKTVDITCSGYSGTTKFSISSNNTSAYSASITKVSNNKAQLKVVGKKGGSGYVNVSMIAGATGDVLKIVSVKVTVTQREPDTFKVSTNSVTMDVGAKKTVSLSYTGYKGATGISCSLSSSSTCSTSVTKTANRSYTVTITGKSAGVCTVYINLKGSSGVLAQKPVTVRVGKLPEVSLSKSSVSVTAGSYVTVPVTLKNPTPGLELSASNGNSTVCQGTITGSGTSFNLKIAGKNAGSSTITVATKTSNASVWSSAQIKVTVTAPPPKVTVSSSSLSLNVGASPYITCSFFNAPANTSVTFQAVKSNNCCNVSWYGSWSSNSHPLMFTGVNPGTCTVTVNLLNTSTKAVLASTTVKVTVTAKSSTKDIKKLSYSFPNYSKNPISLALCRKMFGNTQIAQKVYDYNIGNGGCCFGMSSSAQLMYNGAVSVSGFGKGSVYNLAKTDKNSSLGLSVSDFIECMHISQVATNMYRSYGPNNVAQTIMEQTGKGYPVLIGIYGSGGGHAITAYDYSLTATTLTVSVYDSNYPGREKSLIFTRANASSAFTKWSFKLFDSGTTWSGSSSDSIFSVTFSTLKSVWSKRGSLTTNWKSITGDAEWNLVMTTESDFTLSTLEEDKDENLQQVTRAELENGELVNGVDYVYRSFMVMGATEDGEEQPVYIMLVPKDYYLVEDKSPEDGIGITIMDEGLSATVNTTADTFGMCADEGTIAASVSIAPGLGESYQVSIGSSMPDMSDTIAFSGTGNNTNMVLGLTTGGVISAGEGTAEHPIPDDHTMSVTGAEETVFCVSADCNEGGTISNIGVTDYAEGESACYEIVPEEGYVITAVLVDGEDIGPCSQYCFEEIGSDHTIFAQFARKLGDCTVTVESVSDTETVVTVRDMDGELLEEYTDYIMARGEENETPMLLLMAAPDSGFVGSVELELQQSGDVIRSVSKEGTDIKVVLSPTGHNYPAQLVAAVYESSGRFVGVCTASVEANAQSAVISLADMSLPENCRIKVLLYDKGNIPVTAAKEVEQ